MERLLLRIPEAAELVGLGRTKAYALAADGSWPVIRIDKSIRISRAWLEQWVEDQTAAALVEAGDIPHGPSRA